MAVASNLPSKLTLAERAKSQAVNFMSVNLKTREFAEIGINNISHLFSVICTKNGSEEPNYSDLVPEMGLEPIWISPFDFKSNAYTNSAIRA